MPVATISEWLDEHLRTASRKYQLDVEIVKK